MAIRNPKKPVEFFTWLRSGLRKISRTYPPIYKALADAKRPYVGDNARQRVCYLCAKCLKTYSTKEVAIDHRIDCGSLKCWEDVQGFMQRLFCGVEGLDVLCHTCHDIKTAQTRYGLSEEEAKILKEVAAIMKEPKEDVIQFILDNDFDNVYNTNNAANRKAAVTMILENIT